MSGHRHANLLILIYQHLSANIYHATSELTGKPKRLLGFTFSSFLRDDTPVCIENGLPNNSFHDQVINSRAVMSSFYTSKLCLHPAVCFNLSKKPTRRPDPIISAEFHTLSPLLYAFTPLLSPAWPPVSDLWGPRFWTLFGFYQGGF